MNISGGSVGNSFRTNLMLNPSDRSNSTVNISGGTIGDGFLANSYSVVNISGGSIGVGFLAGGNSEVNISGGSFGYGFFNLSGSSVDFAGGEFRINGVEYTESSLTLAAADTFTGTLADGSSFIFSGNSADILNGVTLTQAMLPAYDLAPLAISSPVTTGPLGLRAGQVVTVQQDGVLPDDFAVVDATLNIEGGELGDYTEVARSTLNISGGTVGAYCHALSDSEVNLSGGNISNGFRASTLSTINIVGTEFILDGVPLAGLVVGESFTITDRDVSLTGLFADGKSIDFDLHSVYIDKTDYFDTNAIVTVTLMPEDFLAGDYNGDGTVDAADYTVWRDSVGQAEYDTWVENFGRSLSDTNVTGVPEPTALASLLIMGVLLSTATGSNRRLS